ncbi:hypothetical protein B0H14DRAFT_3449096 [Mycena olivaceomarginata]|nr:hypothetical protein B0H14DRAFT_3449096 [Mycena olivaceomarginata]
MLTTVGWVTVDNASNNGTMMVEFAYQIRRATHRLYDGKARHLRCLAHIVNLATQAVIKTYSTSKCYNPHAPEEHIPDLNEDHRDVLGLVRAIAVKAVQTTRGLK